MSGNVRGASYPVIDLQKAVTILQKVQLALGRGSGPNLTVMNAAGYTTVNGKSKRVVATLIQYGLITRQGKDYRVTELGMQILFPDDDNLKRSAIAQSALKPAIFMSLTTRYEGNLLPPALSNILINQYSINPGAAENAASVYRRTLEFAGLVNNEGIVSKLTDTSESQDKSISQNSSTERVMSEGSENFMDDTENIKNTSMAAPRHLPSGIILIFPNDLDMHVTFGEFGEALKGIEAKATELRKSAEDEPERPSQI
jgi:hypothetical protein